ncbi:hypothetical protein BZA77DRAFT_358913 [Pyronema omphalodes]|nr:hypothetical protein BZA77DRAFT_358913 [Pyronema omphalodes]
MNFLGFFFLAPLISASIISYGTHKYENGTLIVTPESIPRLILAPSVLSQLNSSENGMINLEAFGLPSPIMLPVTSQDYLHNPTHSKTHCDFTRNANYAVTRSNAFMFLDGRRLAKRNWCCILREPLHTETGSYEGCATYMYTLEPTGVESSVHICGNDGDCIPCWSAGQAVLQVASICRDGWNMKGGYVRLSQYGRDADVVVNKACRTCGY